MDTEETEFTIKGLVENKAYYVRVAAQNDIGTGLFAEYPEPITAKCPHGESFVLMTCSKRCLIEVIIKTDTCILG